MHSLHHFVQVEGRGVQDLSPAVGEKLLRELGGALGARHHQVGVLDEGTVGRQSTLQELPVAHDDDEAIVEVVRDAARELPDGAELLRLEQLLVVALLCRC
jgi:hypothetical protein